MQVRVLEGVSLNGKPVWFPLEWVVADRFGYQVGGGVYTTKKAAEEAAAFWNEGESVLDWVHVETI